MKKVLLFAACLFFLTGLRAQLQTKKNTLQTGQTKLMVDSVSGGKTVAAKAVTKSSVNGGKANQLMLDSVKSGGAAAKAVSKSSVNGGQANQLTVDSVKGGGAQVSRTKTSDKQEKAVTDFIKGSPAPKTPPGKKRGHK